MTLPLIAALSAALPAFAQQPPKAATPPTGHWITKTEVSKMDDSKTVSLTVRAGATVTGWPATVFTPLLAVRCKEGVVDAFVMTGLVAAYEAGAQDRVTVKLRLDQEPAAEVLLSKGTDSKTLFFPDGLQFARNILPHERMVFRFVPVNSAPQETTFDLRGFRRALPTLAAACQWDLKLEGIEQ